MSSTTTNRRKTSIITLVLMVFIGFIMITGGIGHIASPGTYDAMIPSFVPGPLAHGLAVVAELGVAALVIYPKTRRVGALAFAALMLAFLPIHVWDAFRDDPVIGSTAVAWLRIVMQFVLIGIGYLLATRVARERGEGLWDAPTLR